MSVRLGVSPIAWINDDLPRLGAGTPLSRVLGEARETGFSGVELGGTFPRRAAELGAVLASHDLDLAGGWFGGRLLVDDVVAEVARAQAHLALLKAMDCRVFIYAETSNAIHGDADAPLSGAPRLSKQAWIDFGERLTGFAQAIAGEGLRMAYHPHLGTVVEGPADIEAFLRHTGEVVGMTLDTGHAALAGVDAVRLIRSHPRRIAHVHCKDVRRPVFDRVRARGGSFLDGVVAGMFTVPGDGELDWDAAMAALADIAYQGWLVVEAEQDPAVADPKAYSALGLATLRASARAAGLAVEGRTRR
jgi:inosose dehydratase